MSRDLIYLLFYVAFNSQGHIAMGSLQVEETSAYCIVNHRASASNYQLSNMKRPARDLCLGRQQFLCLKWVQHLQAPANLTLELNLARLFLGFNSMDEPARFIPSPNPGKRSLWNDVVHPRSGCS